MTMSFGRELRDGNMTLADVINTCADLGFDGVELSSGDFAQTTEDDVAALLEKRSIALASYIIPANILTADAAVLPQSIHGAKKEIERAVRLQADIVMIVPRGRPGSESEYSAASENAAHALAELSRFGAEQDITITTENFGVLAHLWGKVAHLQAFLEQAPELRITFDDGNFLLAGEDCLQALDALGEKVVHVHLKDWRVVESKERLPFPVPDRPNCYYTSAQVGKGILPTADIINKLHQRGYTGYLSLEHGGAIPACEGAKEALEYVKERLASVD